ncbi:MAG: hypothetical protein U5K27_00120 [Desulfotignum sp.]|nr:hypothetical protein [Desulfotignum sp.]
MQKKQRVNQVKKPMFKDGKLYFTKETERRIFFFMTLIMLASGAVMKLL